MSKSQDEKEFDEIKAYQPTGSVLEYNMNYKSRGIALIFNHNRFKIKGVPFGKRKGTRKDIKALRKCLPLLGFEPENIIIEHDLTKDKILYYWNDVKREEHGEILRNCDCIAIFILSHGQKDNKICANDSIYDLYQLVDEYTADKFTELVGKPKLFFINACRGKSVDPGGSFFTNASCNNEIKQTIHQQIVERQRDSLIFVNNSINMIDTTDRPEYSHSYYADTLISMSTNQEHISFRNKTGSWYIQDLCNSIKRFKILKKLETVDLIEILMYTNYLVSQRQSNSDEIKFRDRKQIPNYNSALCRKLYFRAKIL